MTYAPAIIAGFCFIIITVLYSHYARAHTRPASTEQQHAQLGKIYMDTDRTWCAEKVESLGCQGEPSLSIRGDQTGPDQSCVATYLRLRAEWAVVSPLVATAILEVNHSYFDRSPADQLQSADEVWATSKLLGIGVYVAGEFGLTYAFTWQHKNDSYITTIHFEDWKPAGMSHDG